LVRNFDLKAEKEKPTIELVMGENKVKLRFKNEEEADTWKKGLMEWKDYAIDMKDMNPGNSDVERGGGNDPTISPLHGGAAAGGGHGKSKGDAASELEGITIEDPTDLPKAKPKTGFGAFFGFGGATKAVEMVRSQFVDPKPKMKKEGPLEKKSDKAKLSMNAWSKVYCRISEEGKTFNVYKTSE
jgi:hypothetical protein